MARRDLKGADTSAVRIEVVTFDNLVEVVHDERCVIEIGEELYLLFGPGMLPKVILVFEDAPFVPWAYFESILVGLHKRILKAGGPLKMANLHSSIKKALRRNRLDAIFVIHDSVEEATRRSTDRSHSSQSTGMIGHDQGWTMKLWRIGHGRHRPSPRAVLGACLPIRVRNLDYPSTGISATPYAGWKAPEVGAARRGGENAAGDAGFMRNNREKAGQLPTM